MMKPRGQTEHDEGMLEFLEDIIGSSRLKEPIEELNMKVDQLSEGRGEKVCLVTHAHTHTHTHTHTHSHNTLTQHTQHTYTHTHSHNTHNTHTPHLELNG